MFYSPVHFIRTTLVVLVIQCAFGITSFAQNTVVYFKSDQSNLDEKSKSELEVLLQFISAHPNGKLTISGHTDGDASDAYNQSLSDRRVNAVITYLNAHSKDKLPEIERSAFGESKPVASNSSEKEKALNRRVEISYNYAETGPVTKETPKKGNIEDLYALLLPEFDKHCIDNSRDTLLTCTKGTILKIPADAFTSSTKGCVTISVREALTKSDILLQNLSTKGTEGILISGGMIEIKAFDDEGELFLKDDKKVATFFPTDDVLEDAGTYYGTRDTTNQRNMNWSSNYKNSSYAAGFTLPYEYWIKCWQVVNEVPSCEKCGFFCRLGRIDDAFKGTTNSVTHNSNREFRKCQRMIRRMKKQTVTERTDYCTTVYNNLSKLGSPPDSVFFLNFYAKFMKENGYTTVAETIAALKKIEEERQKAYMEQLKEMQRKDSIRKAGYNAIGISGFGFINCDYFPRTAKNARLINTSTNLTYSSDVDCKLIFTDIRSVMYSYRDGNNQFCFNNVPDGEKVWLMALKYDENDQAYLFLEKMKIGDPVPPVVFKQLSVEQIKTRMKEVDL